MLFKTKIKVEIQAEQVTYFHFLTIYNECIKPTRKRLKRKKNIQK